MLKKDKKYASRVLEYHSFFFCVLLCICRIVSVQLQCLIMKCGEYGRLHFSFPFSLSLYVYCMVRKTSLHLILHHVILFHFKYMFCNLI